MMLQKNSTDQTTNDSTATIILWTAVVLAMLTLILATVTVVTSNSWYKVAFNIT